MISFVVPAFNEEALISQCLHSIILECRNSNYEIIVVDNGSTDSTAELARLCGATVVAEPRKGVTRARQAGLEASKYGLVAFIDADNQILAGWLDEVFKVMNAEGVVAVSGPVVFHDLSLPKRLVSFLFYCIATLVHYLLPMVQGGNFVVDKEAMLRAGGFNTDIDFYGEDTDTAIRLSKVGKIKFILDLTIWSSGRRMQDEGLFVVGLRYIINYLWMWATGHPFTVKYRDHRPK